MYTVSSCYRVQKQEISPAKSELNMGNIVMNKIGPVKR